MAFKGEFKGKVAVVTGGSRGIGEATCHGFAREGAAVVVADVEEVGGRKTAQAIESSGGRALFVKTDVRVSADVERMAQQAVAQFRRIDVLANVAGVQGAVANVVDLPEEEWNRVVGTNLSGTYLCSKHCIPVMLRNGGGSIVNVASLQSYFNVPGSSAYAAAKGGVVSLTRCMALDFAGQAIRINAVAPGYIDTPLLRGFAEATGDVEGTIKKWSRRIPMQRLTKPEEVVEVILFLAGSKASAVTGATYPVDGGMLTAQPTWTD